MPATWAPIKLLNVIGQEGSQQDGEASPSEAFEEHLDGVRHLHGRAERAPQERPEGRHQMHSTLRQHHRAAGVQESLRKSHFSTR